MQDESCVFEQGPAMEVQLGEQVRTQEFLRFVWAADEIASTHGRRRRSGGGLVRHLSAVFANFVHEAIGSGVENGLEADQHVRK